MKKPRTIVVSQQRVVARSECSPRIAGESWEDYRTRENERMLREITAQVIAHLEREAGAIEH